MEYVIKRVNSLEDSCLLINDFTQIIENVMKELGGVFLDVSCLLENMLTAKTSVAT